MTGSLPKVRAGAGIPRSSFFFALSGKVLISLWLAIAYTADCSQNIVE